MIGQQVAQGGEMFWFHSVTVGGSVLCIRKILHILWKVVNSFCAASLRKRMPSAAGLLPRTHSAGPVVSDLLSPI